MILKPGQKMILVPGGASPWKTDPTAFYNYAQTEPTVIGIIAFSWLDYENKPNVGIRVNGMAKAYCEVAEKIKSPTNPRAC